MPDKRSVLLLDDQFHTTLDELESSQDHYFITGRAGTGKSTLLRLWRRTSRKKMVVLAPTGIAALQAGGQTIHSFFRFPPRIMETGDFKKLKNRRLICALDVIIIDEISMVRADMLDNIDRALRLNRGIDQAFGGVQMVFFGDLYQLPPVVAQKEEREYLSFHYETPYFFSAAVWNSETKIIGIELMKIYRQKEQLFLRLLEEIRHNTADQETLDTLNQRYQPNRPLPKHAVTICTLRHLARSINLKKLHSLSGHPQVFQAVITGNFSRSASPAPPELMLKKGAQVMFVKNDPLKRFVNGSLGIVVDISEKRIVVRRIDSKRNISDPASAPSSLSKDTSSGSEDIYLERHLWENIKYSVNPEGKIESEITGTFEQYPLSLAWAMTIHKSQGMTFDQIIIDMGSGAFDYGQTYVALSRCTHLEGVFLKRPLQSSDIQTDDQIVDYYRKIF